MAEVVSEGREFNAVLSWNYSRLSREAAEFVEWSEHGVDLVSATESGWYGALDDEAADRTR